MMRILFYLRKVILRFLFKTHISTSSLVEGNLFSSVIKSNLHISNSKIKIGKNVRIINSNIKISNGELIIGDNVTLTNVEIEYSGNIYIDEFVSIKDYKMIIEPGASLSIGKNCKLEKRDNWRKPQVLISAGSYLKLGNYNVIRCDFELRFGGKCKIGDYNCINERTEIRIDEYVFIGSYNMISYGCRIWDTNTHTLYNDNIRRELTTKYFPNIGIEIDKPETRPVIIKNDNLFGEQVIVLKGSNICDKCVFGTRTVVSGKIIPSFSKIIGNPCRIIQKC